MITWADILIGGGSILMGVLGIYVAVFNFEPAFQLPKARFIEDRYGRRGARIFFAALGLLLVGMGCAVLAGFAPNAERRTSHVRMFPLPGHDSPLG